MMLNTIELLASGYAPQKPWHACEKCGYEYQSLRLAWNCYKEHFRSYERVYAEVLKDEAKHDVVFVGSSPLCGGCASKVKEDSVMTLVRMAEPPTCSRCEGEIRDKPKAEVKPGRLPNSEKHHDLILKPSRDAQETVMRYQWHKKISKSSLNSIGARGDYEFAPESKDQYNAAGSQINAKLFKEFGPYQPDGNGGLVRTEAGYLEVESKKVESCLPKF